jgi:hypothetical protein
VGGSQVLSLDDPLYNLFGLAVAFTFRHICSFFQVLQSKFIRVVLLLYR